MTDSAIAHVKSNPDGTWDIHPLQEHLSAVGKMAAEKAALFGSSDWAWLAGLWHDLGKYRPAFQGYIKSASGYDPEAHIEQKTKIDHSTAGAIYALNKMPVAGRVLAYLIAGHHTGLPDWNTAEAGRSALSIRIDEGKKKNYLEEALQNNIPSHILEFKAPTTKAVGGSEGLHLWLRMLFSCLVDADFLDTEAFMSPDKTINRETWQNIEVLKQSFDLYMEKKAGDAFDLPINKIRANILGSCRRAAILEPGIFSLTVPTGGGKTLSSMAFALEHAIKYKKKRVVVVIPYTSIIEQTADQYREIFGDAVIEHHSSLDPEKETVKSRLACENWEAPIIVTTNVQLLESLFAAKTSRCRKLHNLANSIIIIDEAQLLPPEFLQPVLDVLNLLKKYYGVTLVLSTATQPALASVQDSFGKLRLRGLDSIREIIPNVTEVYNQLNRVLIEKPVDLNQRSSWEEIAENLRSHDSVLAIVNTRKDCRTLFNLMPEGTIHLSGLMCGQHRSDVIAEIKRKLKMNEPVKVISTQLVEAGVDIDFPVVYRALTGLDSIAQAAGRCNREDKLKDKGRVIVFVPPKAPPKGQLLFAEEATRSVWHNYSGHPLSLELYEKYFYQYFHKGEVDKHGITSLLIKDAEYGVVQFRLVAAKFKIIDDKATQSILVPYREEGQKLLDVLRNEGPERYLMRKLQRYSVTIYKSDFQKLKEIGALEEISLGMWAICVTNAYDNVQGLLVADDLYSADASSVVI